MKTFLERTAAFLRDHPNEWLQAREFESVGGRQAWRTRIAECRTVLGMNVENRLRRIKLAGGTSYTLSEYRYVPTVQQRELFAEARA